MLSFILSTYERPNVLRAGLACLSLQTVPDFEVIVTDNTLTPELADQNETTTKEFGFTYLHTSEPCCYSSAARGAELARRKYLAFPSDDDFILPQFGWLMVQACEKLALDFTYSDGVYHPLNGKNYQLFTTHPSVNRIDKCSFIMRRELFTGFKDSIPGKRCPADGMLIESLVKKGYRHAKTEGVLWVHN